MQVHIVQQAEEEAATTTTTKEENQVNPIIDPIIDSIDYPLKKLVFDRNAEKDVIPSVVQVTEMPSLAIKVDDEVEDNDENNKESTMTMEKKPQTTSPPAAATTPATAATTRRESSLRSSDLSRTTVGASSQSEHGRRRSSRVSINGLVIEFDLEDEDEVNLYANCEEYKEDFGPNLKRNDSNNSLEELRTNLEALEHERPTEDLPGLHQIDESGRWGEVCVNKKYLEAMESNFFHNSNGSLGMCSFSHTLDYIPENEEILHRDLDHSDDHINDNTKDDHNDDHNRAGGGGAEEYSCTSSARGRRSTIRSSIMGLVMEYDWTSDEEEDEDEAEEDNKQEVEC